MIVAMGWGWALVLLARVAWRVASPPPMTFGRIESARVVQALRRRT